MKKILVSVFILLFILTNSMYADEPEEGDVTELYIAFFDRAPDSDGLRYWQQSGLSLEQISESFFYQEETQKKYPDTLTNEEFITTIYQNLFDHDPDPDGLLYWVNELENGTMSRASSILIITQGALGDDKIILQNKTEVGLYFAQAGLNDIWQATEVMKTVTIDYKSVEDAKIIIDEFAKELAIVWTKQYGTDSYEWGKAVSADLYGNIYIVGTTGGYLDDETLIGNWDIFLSKFDSHGNKIWTKLYGTSNKDMGNDITVDQAGNVYITGERDGNAFISKIDSKGNTMWLEIFGNPFVDDIGHSIAIDMNGDLYITGVTYANMDNIATPDKGDIFLVKYKNNGVKLWRKQYGSVENDVAYSVKIDSHSDIFVSGSTTGDLEGNTQQGGGDIFLSKFNNDGDQIWTTQFGSNGSDVACSMDIDKEDNIYITGGTSGDLIDNAYISDMWDIFLTKLNIEGDIAWTRQFGTSQFDSACSVATGENKIYITGVTGGDLTGDSYQQSGENIFLAGFNAEGVRISTEQYGSKKADIGYSLTLDSMDAIYITGMTEGNLEGKNSGYGDIFLSKLK